MVKIALNYVSHFYGKFGKFTGINLEISLLNNSVLNTRILLYLIL